MWIAHGRRFDCWLVRRLDVLLFQELPLEILKKGVLLDLGDPSRSRAQSCLFVDIEES